MATTLPDSSDGQNIEMSEMNAPPRSRVHSSNAYEGDRRQSSEIVAIATRMRQEGINKATRAVAADELEELEKDDDEPTSVFECFEQCFHCFDGKGARKEELAGLKQEIDIDWHTKDIEKLRDQYGTIFTVDYEDKEQPDKWTVQQKNIKGLNKSDVPKLRSQYGMNRLTPPPEKPEWVKFCEHLTGFFSLLLWTGGILCFVGFGLNGSQDNLYLGIVLCVVVFLTGVFGYCQDKKSSDMMKAFKGMMPQNCTIIREGEIMTDVAENIVPGDILQIANGQKVPADVRLIFCKGVVEVDNAALTGESEPQKRSTELTDNTALETKNLAFFGTSVVKGACYGVVVGTGDNTVMGRIARLAGTTDNDESPIAKEIHHFVLIVSTVAIILGITFFAVGFAMGTDIITNLVFMIGIIVANVPEGLLATVTVCMALTAHRMGVSNVMVKKIEGVETLGSTSCICSDKTGTLTQNDMTVHSVCLDGKRFYARCGSTKEDTGLKVSPTFEKLLRIATLCNNVNWVEDTKYAKMKNPRYVPNAGGEEGKQFVPDKSKPLPFTTEVAQQIGNGESVNVLKYNWVPKSDATECALAKFAQQCNDLDGEKLSWKELCQIPFNSKNKYQVSVHQNPAKDGLVILMKGAPERVLNRCANIWKDGQLLPFDSTLQDEVNTLQTACSKDGLRVLGFAMLELKGAQYAAFCGSSGEPADFEWNTDIPNFPVGEPAGPKVNPAATAKLNFCGLYAMIDPERPQVPGAVAKCKTAGIRVIMVTGDHPMTAQAIAKKVGIIWGDPDRGGTYHGPATTVEYEEFNKEHGLTPACAPKTFMHKGQQCTNVGYFDPRLAPAVVMPGWELKGKEENEEFWEDVLAHTQIVFARTSPQQKLVIVEHCQETGEIVAVTGDGVNDAPALKKADIGVAMGIMGSDVSKDAADMILLDDNFASIVAGVEEGRLIFDNLKKSIAYTLSSNIPEIAPFIAFILISIPLPLSTVLILCVDLGTDMIPAISMAWENKESDIMRRPPREAARDRLVTRKLVVFAYLQIGVIQAIAGFYTYFVIMYDYGFPAHILPGLGMGDAFGKRLMWCKPESDKVTDVKFRNFGDEPTTAFSSLSSSGWPTYADVAASIALGDGSSPILEQYPFWDGDMLDIKECTYAPKNFQGSSDTTLGGVSINRDGWAWTEDQTRTNEFSPGGATYMSETSGMVMEAQGYLPYIPWRAVKSPFWRGNWLSLTLSNDIQAIGYGSTSDELTELYQPGGTYKLKRGEYKTTGCGGEVIVNGARVAATECCGYTPTGGTFQQTVPFYDPTGISSDSAETDHALSKDAIDDSSASMTVKCISVATTSPYTATVTGTVEGVPVNSYNYKFEGSGTNSEYYYGFDSIAIDNSNTVNGQNAGFITKFPTWDRLAQYDMGGNSCAADATYKYCGNVASRKIQKEALHHAQCAYFVCIVIVQWADLVICKTRMNSIYHQGMLNPAMNFGLIFETLLACILCYTPGLGFALGTRPIKLLHWMPGIPYSILIFLYDELRKKIMRHQVRMETDKQTGQINRIPGWVERNSYY